jgi:hypothetical protein
MGREAVGRDLIGGFSLPTLSCPRRRRRKNVTGGMVLQKRCRKMALFFILIDDVRNCFKN